jgi:hypothetical protein
MRLQAQEAVAGVQRDRLVAEQQRAGAVLDGLRQLPLQHLAGAELEGRELPVRRAVETWPLEQVGGRLELDLGAVLEADDLQPHRTGRVVGAGGRRHSDVVVPHTLVGNSSSALGKCERAPAEGEDVVRGHRNVGRDRERGPRPEPLITVDALTAGFAGQVSGT